MLNDEVRWQSTDRWIMDAPAGKALWNLSVPLIPGLLAFLMVDLVDSYLVLRRSPLAASVLSLTIPAVNILFALGLGLSIAVVARLNVARVRASEGYLQNAVSSNVLWVGVSALSIALISFWLNSYNLLTGLSLFSFDLGSAQTSAASGYLDRRIIAYPFWLLVFVQVAVFRVLGKAVLAGKIFVTWSVGKIVGSFGVVLFWGSEVGSEPEILQVMAAAHLLVDVVFCILCFKKMSSLIGPFTFQFSQSGAFSSLLRIALPASIHGLLNSLMLACITVLVSSLGYQALAVYGFVQRVEVFILFVPMLLTMSFPVFAGQNWALGDFEKVKEKYKQCCFIVLACQSIIYSILFLLMYRVSGGEQYVYFDDIRSYLILVPASYGFLGIAFLSVSMLNSIGFSKKALWVSFARIFMFYIPSIFAGLEVAQMCGFFIGMFVANILSGIFAYCYTIYLFGKSADKLSLM